MTEEIDKVTAGRTAPEDLHVSEIRYRRLFESARDGILILDAASRRITDVNPFMVELMGYSRDEFLGKELWEIGLFKDKEENRDAFRQLQEKGYIRYEDLPLRTKAGGRWDVEFVSNVYREDGRLVIQCNIRDISERKRSEDRLREAERLAVSTLDALAEHIAVLDDAGTVIVVNRAWRNFAAESSAGLEEVCEGANYLAVCERSAARGCEEAVLFAEGLRAVIRGEAPQFSLEYPCQTSSGLLWFLARVTRFRDGGPARFVVSHENITDQKLRDEKLRWSEEWLRTILKASRDGVLIESAELITYVNDAYVRLFGYDQPEDLIGRHVSLVLSAEDAGRMLEFGRRRAAGEAAPPTYEFKGKRKDGTALDLEASVSASVVAGKAYVMTIVRDISERNRAEEALRRSESKYRLLLEQASDGIHTYDTRGNFIETNTKLCVMLGYTSEEMLRLNVADLVPPEDLAAAPVRFDKLQAGETVLTERRLLRKDGTLLPVEISGSMVGAGVLQSIIRDISERKRAEEALHEAYGELERRVEERTAQLARANETLKAENAERLRAEETLRENEQRLKIALQTGNLGSWQLDLDTLELDSSPTCKANFGLPLEVAFTYQDLFAAIHPEDRARVRAAVVRALGGRGDYHAEYRAAWPDGSTHWIVAHGRGIYDAGGRPLRMVGVTADITERRQAEEARRELLRRLVAAQEDERRRISRELHDQTGQHLTALILELKSLEDAPRLDPDVRARLRRLREGASDLGRDVHALAWGLRPSALDDFGLDTALRHYAEEWSRRAGVPVDFQSAGFDRRRFPPAIETALYRVVQEALTNVLRHARARRVSVILERRRGHALAVVEDDGCGFEAELVTRQPTPRRGMGLLGMRERVQLLNGTIEIESTQGKGTTVFARVPVSDSGEGAHE